MKRLVSILLICLMLAALIPQAVAEQNIVCTFQKGVLTISGKGEVNGGTADVDLDLVERVVIMEGITGIADYGFAWFDAMTEIQLPDSLERIGEGAFLSCVSLKECSIPAGVTEIGQFAFYECADLEAIRVSPENKSFTADDRGVLYSKDKTVLLAAPGGMTGEYQIPEGTRKVGDHAFAACMKLQGVTIPAGVSHIGMGVFAECAGLQRVSFGEGLLEIGDIAFFGCIPLMYVTFPRSLQKIGEEAFAYCRSLKGVEMREGLQSIGRYAFSDTDLRTVRIPNSVTELGTGAFAGCPSLQSFTLGSGVKEFELEGYNIRREILVDPENPNYESRDGVLFSKDGKTLLCYPTDRKGTYEIPDGVESIANNAFYFSSLSVLKIPDSVTSISEQAFWYCYDLRSVELGDGIRHIPGSFYQCDNLSSITFGKNIEGLERVIYDWGCFSIRSLYFKGNAPDETRFDLRGLDEATVYFAEGTEGWTGDTWNGLPCASWDPEKLQFSDMPDGEYWSNEALQYAVKNGYMRGTSLTEISPEETASRAMFVTMLSRMEDDYLWGYNEFEDVPDDEWYTEAVAWAAYHEIVMGVGNGRFDPHAPVTREQVATFLFRYANMCELNTFRRKNLSNFVDASEISDWAEEAMQWAVAVGIINGYYGDLLKPQDFATREEIATIFMRYLEEVMLANSRWTDEAVTLYLQATPFCITNDAGGDLRFENWELQGSMPVYWEGYTTGSPAGLDVKVDPSEYYLYENTRDTGFSFGVGYEEFYASVGGAGLKRARIGLVDYSVEVEGEPSEYRVFMSLARDVTGVFVIMGNSEGNFSICQTGDVIMIEGLYGEQLCEFFDIADDDGIPNEVPFTFNGKNYFDLSDLETDGVIHFCNGETNTVIQSIPYSTFVSVPET